MLVTIDITECTSMHTLLGCSSGSVASRRVERGRERERERERERKRGREKEKGNPAHPCRVHECDSSLDFATVTYVVLAKATL